MSDTCQVAADRQVSRESGVLGWFDVYVPMIKSFVMISSPLYSLLLRRLTLQANGDNKRVTSSLSDVLSAVISL